jgi:hypothetical protein
MAINWAGFLYLLLYFFLMGMFLLFLVMKLFHLVIWGWWLVCSPAILAVGGTLLLGLVISLWLRFVEK